MRRIIALARKEFIQIIRDPRSLWMTFVMPVIMLILYGYAVVTDVKNIKIAILDRSKTPISRQLIDKFKSTGYFEIKRFVNSENEIKSLIDAGIVPVAVSIPVDFEKKIYKGQNPDIQIIVDGTDSNTATITSVYINGLSASMAGLEKINNVETKIWFNPELRSTNFIVPGLICIIMMMISVILMSTSIVAERERGTFEGLISTPIKSYELILGKLFPYAVISLIEVIIITLIGAAWFHVPIKGSFMLFIFMSLIFLLCALGLGLLISTVAHTQQEAMIISFLTSLLPTFLLSGFVFPISSMPKIIQYISFLVPAKYFLVILRGIFLKGIGLEVFWKDALFLFMLGSFLCFLSLRRFKKRLD
jgi:ABC-2 type transport system permease protein